MIKKEGRIIGFRINAINLGLAGGILFGACIFLMTLCGILFSWFPEILSLVSDMYGFLGILSYDVTPFGLITGTVYGFIDGFLFFWILGLLYNKLR